MKERRVKDGRIFISLVNWRTNLDAIIKQVGSEPDEAKRDEEIPVVAIFTDMFLPR